MSAASKWSSNSFASQVTDGFLSLKGSPRELWTVFLLKVLESFNYFSLSITLTLYLTEEFGISDLRAGELYGLWGVLTTLYGFVFGWSIDWLGVKYSFLLCGVLGLIGRLLMAATQSRTAVLVALFLPSTLSGALGVPVLLVAIKRLTNEGNRGFAFALFYSLMNTAALATGLLRDLFCITLARGLAIASLPEHSLLNRGPRLFMLLGCITSLAEILVTVLALPQIGSGRDSKAEASPAGSALLLSRRNTTEDEGAEEVPEAATQSHGLLRCDMLQGGSAAGIPGGIRQLAAARLHRIWLDVKAVVGVVTFWKFLALCIVTINLKSIFRHLDATLPKYQTRSFGCYAPVGLIYSINPFMIIILVPIVGALTTRFNHYDMIHYGGYLSALSPFWIALLNTAWAPVLFVIQLSLGEAVWSPRWYDLSMSVAPNGREGMFTALASAPLFAASFPTGMMSGWLLQRFCPDTHACDADKAGLGKQETALQASAACRGRPLWLIIGLVTLTTPLAMLIFQGCLRPANNLPSGEVTEDRRRAGHDERLAGLPIPVNYADPIEADLLPAYASEHGKSGVAKPSPEMQITSSTV